jgi:type IV pilus assembly protein PilA
MKGLRRGEKGFTLIELLIVVAILGILAAVIIPNLSTFMGTGTLSAARTEAENVKTAALAYYADHNGTWPATSAALEAPSIPAYIQGDIKGVYTFNTTTGRITTAGTSQGTWTGLTMTWNETTQTWDRTA